MKVLAKILPVLFAKRITCPACNGSGKGPFKPAGIFLQFFGGRKPCKNCKGKGTVYVR